MGDRSSANGRNNKREKEEEEEETLGPGELNMYSGLVLHLRSEGIRAREPGVC